MVYCLRMRLLREYQLIPDHEEQAGNYHIVNRAVWKTFIFADAEKEYLYKTMREFEKFSGVRVLTFCLMSNHFHYLLKVPAKRDAEALLEQGDEVFLERIGAIYSADFVADMRERMEKARADGAEGDRQGLTNDLGVSAGALAEEYVRDMKRPYLRRMCDLSEFMKAVKQRFTQWYNKKHNQKGTVWEGRFRSELIESGYAAQTVAAYIDLNPVRAGIVEDPKDYRWCGYGEAVAGVEAAQVGLLDVMRGVEDVVPNAELSENWQEVMGDYRMVLAVDGVAADPGVGEIPIQGESKSKRHKKRHGFSRDDVEGILASGGKLSRAELLRCKVRYFSDGVVLGSKEFVNVFYDRMKSSASAAKGYDGRYDKRITGARKVRGVDGEALFNLRDLKKDVVG